MAASPNFPATPKIALRQLANADGTTKASVFTAGTNGSWIHAFLLVCDDTVSNNFRVWIKKNTVSNLLTSASVPAAPSNGATEYNLLDPNARTWLDPNAIGFPVEAGCEIEVNAVSAISSGKTAWISIIYGDY